MSLVIAELMKLRGQYEGLHAIAKSDLDEAELRHQACEAAVAAAQSALDTAASLLAERITAEYSASMLIDDVDKIIEMTTRLPGVDVGADKTTGTGKKRTRKV